jgi:hypothetical protein
VIHGLLLLSREHDGSEDGDEDEDGGDFEGEQKFSEEDGADLGDVAGDVVEIAADVGGAEGVALGEEDEAEQAEDSRCAREADEIGGTAAVGSLFFAGVEQHDDEDEEDHDGAGVHDDLGGGEELGPKRPVEDGEGHHDDDQRESAVDGVTLQEEVECSCYGQRAKDDKESQLHDGP